MADFLRRNRVLLTSCGLLVLSILLVSVSVRSPDTRDPVARALLDALAPLQAGVTLVRTTAHRLWDDYFWLVKVSRENRELHSRLAVLEQQRAHLEELARANRRLEVLLDFRAGLGGKVYGARVIGRDPLLASRTVTVDRGERDGIRNGMAVLSPQGVVGHVINVSRTAARALVLTDHNSGIDAVIQRTRARGIVQGAMEKGCHMKYLRRGEDVAVGDRVVTSGMDGIFPKGILIGEVTDVSRRDRGLLQVATIRPSAPLERIEEVLLVDAAHQTDQEG
jgi:rod shape-determining protein MreC